MSRQPAPTRLALMLRGLAAVRAGGQPAPGAACAGDGAGSGTNAGRG